MAATITTPAEARSAPAPTTGERRGWAWAGAVAGLAGIAMFVASMSLAVSDDSMADSALVLQEILDEDAAVWAFQVACSLGALCATVFAAGLRRRLAAQAPAESLLPTLAAAGLASVAIMLLVGGGISTELFWALVQDHGEVDPDIVAANLGIFDTMAWVWAGIGLTSGSLAVAGIRHGSLPRWLGWLSAAVTGLIVLTQLLPVQYLAAFVGAPWLVVAGAGLARADRA